MGERRKIWLVILAGLLAMACKLALSRVGHNADFNTWVLFSDLVLQGKDVYDSLKILNYGPGWFNFLAILRTIAPDIEHYRILIIIFLSLCDLGIALILLRQFGLAPALVFALNPLSMLISGFHNQFDCLAILLALIAMVFYQRYEERDHDLGQLGLAMLMLTVSFLFKHILFMLPLALLWRPKPLRHNLLLAVPWLVFALSIAAYLNPETYKERLDAILFYRSHWGTGLVYRAERLVLPYFATVGKLGSLLDYLSLFVPVVGGGYLLRRENPLRMCAFVLALGFAFTPMVANQYVVIPMVFVALYYRNPLHWYYMILGVFFILGHHHGLRIAPIKGYMGKQWQILQAPILVTLLYYLWPLARQQWVALRHRSLDKQPTLNHTGEQQNQGATR